MKKVVRDTAETEFASQLNENKGQIASTITSQFGPAMFKNFFGQINPANQLSGIVGGAGGQFLSKLGLGGGGAGGLGGLANNLGGGGGGFGGFGF